MPTLETTDLEIVREYFNRTQQRIAEVTNGLSEAQWRFKPAPDRWSIAENLEHMVTIEARVLGPIREQLAVAPPPPPEQDFRFVDALLIEKVPDRTERVNPPGLPQPTGTWTIEYALSQVRRNYERLSDFVESTPDLREHAVESAPLKHLTKGELQVMDAYQWALLVTLHDERHVRQILEVKDDPNYPQS